MPDAAGNFKGSGWSRAGEAAWERAFGNAASQQPEMLTTSDVRRRYDEVLVRNGLPPLGVPREPTPEVVEYDGDWHPDYTSLEPDEWLADRSEAEEDWGELADEQAARDGYNPAW